MALAVAGIGSNKGHRRSLIERAVALISAISGISNFRCSSFYESEPWGYDSASKFLNVCVAFDTDIGPRELFSLLSAIEKSISMAGHRDASGNYIDREIDIDFIAYDTVQITGDDLILPHPRAHLRDFVMIPFMEVAPEFADKIRTIMTDNSLRETYKY